MKTKIILTLFTALFLTCSLTYAQTDSLKIHTLKNNKVEIGKYYEIAFPDIPPLKGKLLAVNNSSILVLTNNRIEEIEIFDILSIKSINAESIIYTTENYVKFKPVYSLSGGYSQRSIDHYSYSSYYSNKSNLKFSGFNILGDALMKTSDNFGFRIDLNYIHTFGKKLSGDTSSYYSIYDSTYRRYDSDKEYAAQNVFTLKTGICFGSMSRNDPFNFYINLGLGFGWLMKNDDISFNYTTKNGITTVTQHSYNSSDGFLFGVHAQIRLSYKVHKDYSLFLEPTVQYWSTGLLGLYAINGGITFTL